MYAIIHHSLYITIYTLEVAMARTQIYFDDDAQYYLKEIAAEEHRSLSDLIRWQMDKLIEQHKKKKRKQGILAAAGGWSNSTHVDNNFVRTLREESDKRLERIWKS